MSKPGKRFRNALSTIDREKLYPLEEAVKLVKGAAKAKFDETIEVAMNLGVDPRHADQMVRGVCALPHGSGRKLRVGVFAKGAKAEEAKKAGLIHAGVGKASFTEEALVANIRAFADAVLKAKPSGAKGTFLKRVAVASTMGPGVKIEPASLAGG